MRARPLLGTVLLPFAIGTCLLLGTFGWFAVGFGVMTDCTNNYSCSTTGCSPCADTGLWINVGGIAQWVLASVGAVVLLLGVRAERWTSLVIGAAALLMTSALTIVGTTWRAEESYCQPGSPGYRASYCSTGA